MKSSLISQHSKADRDSPQPSTSQQAANFDAVNVINEQNLNLNSAVKKNSEDEEDDD